MPITWLDVWEILLETFWWIFKKKFECVFQGQTLVWPHLRDGWLDWCKTKKEVHRLHTGHTIWPWPLTSPMTLILNIIRSNFELAISGMGWAIDIERKGYESSINDHDNDLHMTMMGWADVLDSYRGDFRRWRAVDISSFYIEMCSSSSYLLWYFPMLFTLLVSACAEQADSAECDGNGTICQSRVNGQHRWVGFRMKMRIIIATWWHGNSFRISDPLYLNVPVTGGFKWPVMRGFQNLFSKRLRRHDADVTS